MELIPKTNLTLQVVHQLRRSIVRGELSPGAAVREVELAAQLGVSRTPIREALRQLQAEGLVECTTGKAATVTSLSPTEVREIYPMIGALERVMLESAEPADAQQIAQLRQLDQELRASAGHPAQAIALDTRWHELLLERGTNQRARKLLRILKRQAWRYEWVFMFAGEEAAADDHEGIALELGAGNTLSAARLLEVHWVASVQSLLGHMKKAEDA